MLKTSWAVSIKLSSYSTQPFLANSVAFSREKKNNFFCFENPFQSHNQYSITATSLPFNSYFCWYFPLNYPQTVTKIKFTSSWTQITINPNNLMNVNKSLYPPLNSNNLSIRYPQNIFNPLDMSSNLTKERASCLRQILTVISPTSNPIVARFFYSA